MIIEKSMFTRFFSFKRLTDFFAAKATKVEDSGAKVIKALYPSSLEDYKEHLAYVRRSFDVVSKHRDHLRQQLNFILDVCDNGERIVKILSRKSGETIFMTIAKVHIPEGAELKIYNLGSFHSIAHAKFSISDNRLDLYKLHTKESCRKKGYAKELINEIISIAHSANKEIIGTSTVRHEDAIFLQSFFQRKGFDVILEDASNILRIKLHSNMVANNSIT